MNSGDYQWKMVIMGSALSTAMAKEKKGGKVGMLLSNEVLQTNIEDKADWSIFFSYKILTKNFFNIYQ